MSQFAPVLPLLLDVPEEPLEPEEPEELPLEPEDPLEPLEPEDPLEPLDVPVSGLALSVVPASTGASLVFGGSLDVLPASGSGSSDFWSCTSAPSPSSGEVAHAEIRATTDRTPTAMRLERRMAGTVAAELYLPPVRHDSETLR